MIWKNYNWKINLLGISRCDRYAEKGTQDHFAIFLRKVEQQTLVSRFIFLHKNTEFFTWKLRGPVRTRCQKLLEVN